MFFWLREVAGWGLILLSLYWLRMGINFVWDLSSPQIIQASIIIFASLGVLRAGIFLLRLSTTTRLAMRGKAADATNAVAS
jgi:hypothetical protein